MKIYQVISCGGQWEDYYEFVEGTFLNKDKAQALTDHLKRKRNSKVEQYEKCYECPYACNNVYEEINEEQDFDCEFMDIRFDEYEDYHYCYSDKQNYSDEFDESYTIKEIEVIE